MSRRTIPKSHRKVGGEVYLAGHAAEAAREMRKANEFLKLAYERLLGGRDPARSTQPAIDAAHEAIFNAMRAVEHLAGHAPYRRLR